MPVASKRDLGRIALAVCLIIMLSGASTVQGQAAQESNQDDARPSLADFEKSVKPFLTAHCNECHGSDKPKGDLNLSALDPDMKASTSAGRWALVLEKIENGQMPPKKVTTRPDKTATDAILEWIRAEMKRSGKHLARRETVHNGNEVPHALLFDPKQTAALDAESRVRRLSPEIYDSFSGEVGKGAIGVGQPFSPEGSSTFKDMGDPKIDEPVTALLIRNALSIVEKQTAHKVEDGQVKGLPRELTPLFEADTDLSDEQIATAIRWQFDRVLKREPTDAESKRFITLMKRNVKDVGREIGVKYTLAAVFLLPEAVFRMEVGGKPDAQGRIRLTPREIAHALAYALTDKRPDGWLLDAAKKGQLDTDEGVGAAVKRMLDDPKLQKPRILRFFQEYFEYEKAGEVFKDQKAFEGHDVRELVADTDRLIEYILEQDKNVLYELLTTNKSFIGHKKADEITRRREEGLKKFEEDKAKNPEKFKGKEYKPFGRSIYESYNLDAFPATQPVELPKRERAGILTQPAWLVAFSKADENDVIHRGKWVRERLLGGVVPDVPITVDAQLPEEPHHTLRQRMRVTQQEYCWQCHKLMNRVGYPFESFDHFGRRRTVEPVLDPEATEKNVDAKGKHLGNVMKEMPVNAAGGIEFVLDKSLEGDADGAIEFIHRIARSELVEQVFVRHAFRYWMGRNETPGDARSLQAIHKAYRDSGGSMKAMITAMLTSESFLYRIPPNEKN